MRYLVSARVKPGRESALLFNLEILLARRGMFQCSNKFSNCFPRLDNSTTHRDMIFRHLDIWRFDTAVLKLLSRVSGLSADAR